MKNNTINIQHTVFINKPCSVVWDYTQNYDNRHKWDGTVLQASVLEIQPHRVVRLQLKGNTIMTLHYKLDEAPHKTSLVAREVQSPIIESAGGSWHYTEHNGGTMWSQQNTVVLKNTFTNRLLLPFLKRMFTAQTKSGMRKAKKLLEQL